MKLTSIKSTLAHLEESHFFREGTKSILAKNETYDLQLSVDTPEALLKKIDSKSVDIILVGDFETQEYPIDSLLIHLIDKHPKTAIAAFQSTSNYDEINHLIKMGIKCFIPKNASVKEFFKSLNKMNRDGFYFETELTRDLIEKVQKEQKLNDLNLALSGIEKQILQFVSNGFTAEEISTKLNKSKKTIEGYRYRMLKKANVKNIAELVAWGFRNKVVY
ncbi:MAG: response regulator transcription factor [Bacteroidota bacterium]